MGRQKKAVSLIETHHCIQTPSKTLEYTTGTGLMPIRNDKGKKQANIFFTSYTLDDVSDTAARPLVFVFNGGPGSSSVWLHLGALGPKRVKMQDEGWMPAPPYQLVDNEYTWLDFADLVFIDPVGTGYSRAIKAKNNKKYWNVESDLESVGEFIRLYLTRYKRWSSPLFLAGESYGTTRAAGLSDHLFKNGIAFNGIILISTILNFQTARFERGNDLPYQLFVPTYTASAWYHEQLSQELQSRDLLDVLEEVELWIANEYSLALAKGDSISQEERDEIIEKLSYYTGLESRFVDNSNLRIQIMRFCKELLREQKRTVGRLDSRFKGINALAVTEFPEFDPSLTSITPPYTAMMNDYVRSQLGYETDTVYEILSFKVNSSWEWEQGKFPDTSEALRSAMTKNPFMKIFVAQGYYDLATPYYAAEYTFDHMDIDPELKNNIQLEYYQAGHMVYLDMNSLAKLKADIDIFMTKALPE